MYARHLGSELMLLYPKAESGSSELRSIPLEISGRMQFHFPGQRPVGTQPLHFFAYRLDY